MRQVRRTIVALVNMSSRNCIRNKRKTLQFLLFFTFLLVILYSTVVIVKVHPLFGGIGIQSEPTVTAFLRADATCHFPQQDPFHSSIKHLIGEPEGKDCTAKYPLLFNSTFSSTLVPLKTVIQMRELGIKSCCYKRIRRPPHSNDDDSYELSYTCYPLSLVAPTEIPPHHELLAIYCDYGTTGNNSVLMDTHAFVHLNTSHPKQSYSTAEERLSVAILGLDSLSHMNFLRSMPKSYSFLRKELDAVEMHGFNSVGYNTYPNLVAALTSRSEKEIASTCLKNKLFDECPYIWKNFSDNGFLTAFGEDSGKEGGIFVTYWKGFAKPPTDYYLRPLQVLTEEKLRATWDDICYGPRLAWRFLLNYAQRLSYTMNKESQRYFQFLWSTALTHDGINNGRLADNDLVSTLEWFKSGGYLNKTILILISDHGARAGPIMNTQQGQLEKRMPFLYFVVPSWFKEKYPRAFQNLMANQDRLTTHFDLYETLADLVILKHISNEDIRNREKSILTSMELKPPIVPRGISLFVQIPLGRTCKLAGIEDHYCVCRNFENVSTNDPVVYEAANYAVYFINQILSKFPQCAKLSLASIQSAKVIKAFEEKLEQYHILFKTVPNNATFEATVGRIGTGNWTISGTIDRTNRYGNQSRCVNDREAKLYCDCDSGKSENSSMRMKSEFDDSLIFDDYS